MNLCVLLSASTSSSQLKVLHVKPHYTQSSHFSTETKNNIISLNGPPSKEKLYVQHVTVCY